MSSQLCHLIEREGVAYEEHSLKYPVLGIYYYTCRMDRPVIVVSSRIVGHQRLYRCVLAEELGHHYTGAVGQIYCYSALERDMGRSRWEYRALKWAAQYLIPGRCLAEALGSGIVRVHDLAEHFEVTEGLAKFRLELSRRIGEVLWHPREIA